VDEAEARRRFARARVGRIATLRPDGSPHVVPFVFAADGDSLYWVVDDKPKSSRQIARLTNVAADPRVEAVVDSYDEDWSRLWWVRASGLAEVLAGGDQADHALRLLAAKYPAYGHATPPGPVVSIRVTRWTWWEGFRQGR